jgi:hypothetical protein
VRLHPKIKGVDGTASAEVPLVSFNEDAFESYGKKQGFNAPTSESVAFRYGAALNGLLDRVSSRNRLRVGVGDATVVFWADTSGVGEEAATAAEDDRSSGRTRENFRLWRDKDALAVGEHWKAKLKEAVSESVFFITMVTPSAGNSPFCRFEFESFVERERALGRDDLVFPILYITVPELEDERKETDPVVSIIAERQYVDWRSIRHGDVNSTAVKRTVEEFCKDIAKKLRQPWISLEERGAIDAENRAKDERRRQEAAAKRRAEEEERRESVEARRRAEEEEREIRPRAV